MSCISLAIGYPTVASVPHLVVNGFKNLLAVAAETDIEFKEAQQVKTLSTVLCEQYQWIRFIDGVTS